MELRADAVEEHGELGAIRAQLRELLADLDQPLSGGVELVVVDSFQCGSDALEGQDGGASSSGGEAHLRNQTSRETCASGTDRG